MADDAEPREIEQTGSKIIDPLLANARESGLSVKLTEELKYGHTYWRAEFRIPVWGRPGSLLRQEQEYEHLSVSWMLPSGKGRRPRFLTASRNELLRTKWIKRPKDMRWELAQMRREAEKATARLALRKGGERWRLEMRNHRHETLASRTVTLAEAEYVIAVASELTAILAEEIRFFQWDTEAKEMVRSALVPVVPEDVPATPWGEVGEMIEDAGSVGGDIQIGAAPQRRFTHATLHGRIVDVTAYPIRGDGSDPMPPEDAPIHLSWQTCTTICRDVEDPGGTEEWADIEYSDLPEAYTGTYATVEDAERAARRLIRFFDPAHIGWDGRPDFPLSAPHAYTWADVRRVDARELKVGDIFVTPGMGNMYRADADGRVSGTTWALDGTAWCVQSWVNDTVTAISHTGQEKSQQTPEGAKVLRVEPSGTCDRCKREVRPWPLERGDRCAPKGWAYCIRRA